MNYEKDIIIDESALDLEWLNQPSLFMKYAKNAAKAQMELDHAKQSLDIAKAEADKEIRENPEKFDLVKATEVAIANTILIHPQYKEAYDAYLEAKYECEMARSAVTAFDQRKNALEYLVKLLGQNYFAGPALPRNISKLKEQRQQQTDAGIAQKMKRNK